MNLLPAFVFALIIDIAFAYDISSFGSPSWKWMPAIDVPKGATTLSLLAVCIFLWGRPKFRKVVAPTNSQFAADKGGKKDYDLIIIGAGVAGASIGAAISKNEKLRKLKVLIVERSWEEPNRIVGELLQPGGVEEMRKLGIEDCLDGFDAVPVYGYGIKLGEDNFYISYPKLANGEPAVGRGFHNGRFLTRLRGECKKAKNIHCETGNVTQLLEKDGKVTGVVYENDSGVKSVHAPLTVVCDGLFSLFRKSLNEASINVKSKFLGLVLKDAELPYGNSGQVILAKPSPVLVYPISSTENRMLIDFPTDIPDASTGQLQKYLLETVLPQLPESIQDSFREAAQARSFLSMPNRSLGARPLQLNGCVLIGDALNMRHPLTGGGMTVALTDVNNLLQRLQNINIDSQKELSAAIDSFYHSRRSKSCVINMLADALYDVFCADSEELRDACHCYLKKGGWYAHGPISLLSGVTRAQAVLLVHFFHVALYGIFSSLFRLRPDRALRIWRRALKISLPLIIRENEYLGYGVGPFIVLFCRVFGGMFGVFW